MLKRPNASVLRPYRLGTIGLVLVALVTPTDTSAHAGPGLLVGPDGTVYFTMFGPFPLMMIRPGGEPEFAIAEVGPTWLHHIAWLPDGRIAVANDRGEVYAVTPGEGFERYLSAEALARLAEAELPEGVAGPLTVGAGLGGDPFTIGEDGSIYTVVSSIDRPRVVRISPDGTLTILAGGARRVRDGRGEEAGFGGLHSSGMATDGAGGLYVIDGPRLRHVAADGTARTLVTLDGWFTGITVDRGAPHVTVAAEGGGPDGVARLGPAGSYEVVMFDERLEVAMGVAFGPSGAIYVKDHPHGATRVWRWSPRDGLQLVGIAEDATWLGVLYPDADFGAGGPRSPGSGANWLYLVFAVAAGVGFLSWRRGRATTRAAGENPRF